VDLQRRCKIQADGAAIQMMWQRELSVAHYCKFDRTLSKAALLLLLLHTSYPVYIARCVVLTAAMTETYLRWHYLRYYVHQLHAVNASKPMNLGSRDIIDSHITCFQCILLMLHYVNVVPLLSIFCSIVQLIDSIRCGCDFQRVYFSLICHIVTPFVCDLQP